MVRQGLGDGEQRNFHFGRGWLLALVLACVVLVSTGQAFDGQRKGFVAGLGIGVSPVAHWTIDNSPVTVDEVGLGINGMLGYAWDDRNMLVGENNISLYRTDKIGGTRVVQGWSGVAWYHYWGQGKRKPFTMVGLGYMMFSTEYDNIQGDGYGYVVGGGLELFKQVQIGAYYSGGRTSDTYWGEKLKASHGLLNLLVTMVAY